MIKEKAEVKTTEKYNYGLTLVYKLVRYIFPEVGNQLKYWSTICDAIEDRFLRIQALSSIKNKKFHVQGGCIYALYPGTNIKQATKFIVSLQTISDYLDNLCDRAEKKDESAFRQLHLAMIDSVDPFSIVNNYYHYYPYKNDNNYLGSLVETCKAQIRSLPSYYLVYDSINKFVELYSDMQTYKHLEDGVRENSLKNWAEYYSSLYPEITCWEFSAAAGSTLGIFVLFAAAFSQDLTLKEVKMIEASYFPWICGLHILLDYYIDAQEDIQMGDLNFTNYYHSLKQCEERIEFFLKRSLESCSKLPYPEFHITIIKGLLSMYLSDPKAYIGMNKLASKNILSINKSGVVLYHKLCKILRVAGAL